MRVAFFGMPLAALLLAHDGHDIVWAGTCRPGALGTRRLGKRVERGHFHVRPDLSSDALALEIERSEPNLLVSWFWTQLLPPRILAIAPALGVHPSLLPRHRGPDPYFWAIDSGDVASGVTAHLLSREYDTGDVLGRRRLAVRPEWNAWQLARALDRPSLDLLRETIGAIAVGGFPSAKPQDETLATYAPQPRNEDLAVQWGWSADRIERRVRAAAPWPGAWTEIGERLVTLTRVRRTVDFPHALAPGEAAIRADGIAVIRAGTDALEIHRGRDENDAELTAANLAAVVKEAQAIEGVET